MLTFALLPVPQALANVAPTLSAYEASYASALSLDGGVHALTPTPLVDELPPLLRLARCGWRSVASTSDDPLKVPVSAATIATVERCMRSVDAATLQLGTTARSVLQARLGAMGEWVVEHHDATQGSIMRFAHAQLFRVRRDFLRRHGARRLWLELRDERQREAAHGNPIAREAYLSWWYARIGKLQRKLSWHVPGYSGEDVAGELLALLISALDSRDDTPFLIGGAPGIEGTFSFLVRKKRWLQRRQRLHEVVPPEAFGTIGERTPTGEDLVMARQQREQAGAVIERAGKRLRTRKQRRYFDVLLEDASEHGYVSEVRIAESLGVDKSTVSRAVKVVVEALHKSGASDVLEGLKPGGAPREAPALARRQNAGATAIDRDGWGSEGGSRRAATSVA